MAVISLNLFLSQQCPVSLVYLYNVHSGILLMIKTKLEGLIAKIYLHVMLIIIFRQPNSSSQLRITYRLIHQIFRLSIPFCNMPVLTTPISGRLTGMVWGSPTPWDICPWRESLLLNLLKRMTLKSTFCRFTVKYL